MKLKIVLTLVAIALPSIGNAQTNTFPASGNVGVGTTSPDSVLSLGNWNQGSAGSSSDGSVQLQVSGQHNQGVNNGSSSGTIKLKIEGYNNDGPTVFPIYVMDENGLVDFWLKNRPSATEKPTMFFDGNIGIASSTPSSRLTITADTPHTGNEFETHGLAIKAGSSARSIWIGYDAVADIGYINAAKAGSHQPVVLQSRGGNVGIGTTNPGVYKLAVNGTIRAKEVVVDTGWSDFVFEPSYRLRSLNEVESHIAEYGHLPDVPSAESVESEGLSVGEAQKIMMQKIEELTLYVIEQDKKLSVQQKLIDELLAEKE